MGKLFNGFVVLLLIAISVSAASGLSVTASVGANGDSSSTLTQYGATINDHVKEQIQLKPEDHTLSGDISGTGTLPYQALAIKDSKGNYAQVYRSVIGTDGVTTYDYSWNTQKVPSASGPGVSASLTLNANNANIITGGSSSYNREGDKANADIEIKSASPESILQGYHTEATAFINSAEADQSLGFAAGDLVDVKSHAQDMRLANEYLSYSNGKFLPIRVKYGGADFEVQAPELKDITVSASATANNVVITPSLPSNIKTAIMLEPMNYAFTTKAGATDLGSTVFPDLVGSGYATLRYTDAGASIDKFDNLGQYDVVLVNSHMGPDSIGLSTTGGSLPSYTTSKNSLVILAGCESFDGYPTTKSSLANWVSGAYLSGGYTDSVGTLWNNDYLSNFFDDLSKGDLTSVAATKAWDQTKANTKYSADSPYYLPLVFYPTSGNDFKL
jgi:hypothetical protein